MKKSSTKPRWWSLLVSAFLVGTSLGGASYGILQFTQTSGKTSSTMGLPNFVYGGGPVELAEKLGNRSNIRGGETHFRDESNTQVIRCAQVLPKSLENTTWEELYVALEIPNSSPNNGLIDPVGDQTVLESLGVCSAWLPVPVTSDWHIDQRAYDAMLEANPPKAYPESSIFTTNAIISFLTLLIISLVVEILLSDDTLAVTNKIFFLLKPFVPKKIDEEFSKRISEGIKNPGNFQIVRFFCSMILFSLVLNLMTSAVSPIPFSDVNQLGLKNYTTCVSDNELPSIKDMGGISPTGRDENGELIPFIRPLTKQECDPNGKYYPTGQVVRIVNHWLVQALGPAFANSKTIPIDEPLRALTSPLPKQFIGTLYVYQGLKQLLFYWFLMVLVGILMNFKTWLIKNFIVNNKLSGSRPPRISSTTLPRPHLPKSVNQAPQVPNGTQGNLREIPPIDINFLNDRPKDDTLK